VKQNTGLLLKRPKSITITTVYPRNKSVISWRLLRSKSTISPHHRRQFCNKLAWAKALKSPLWMCCVVPFPEFHYNDLLPTCYGPTCCGVVGRVAIKPCPHCRRKVRLSQKTARKGRQWHFSATVWTGLNKSATSWQLPRLQGTYGEMCSMDFGQNSVLKPEHV